MNDVIDSSLGSDSATSAVDALPGQVGQTRRPFSGLGSTVTGTGTTTGSWAESTHSVIWLTRGGNRLPLARVGRRSWGTNLISVAVIALTSLIAASNLLDVYGSAAMWAVAAVPATLLGALIAYAGTAPALRLWWQIVFLIVAQGVIGPVIALNDTAISHVIPSVETLSQGFVSTFGAFKYLIAVPPPTGSGDGSLMAAWTICLWLSFLAGVFAIGDKRQLSVLSLLPIAIELVVCALLGTQTGFQPIASGVLIGLIMIVWLSWRWQLLELGRWISATIILLLAAGLGVGACMGIGQSRLILRDYYDPPLSPYDYASPLSGLRSYVKDHKDDTLLTVTNLPEGTPVRLAVMDQFDGNVWNLSDSTEASDSSDYRRVGTRIPQYGRRQEVHRHVHHRQGSERQMAAAGRSGEQRRRHVSGKDRRRQRKRRRRIPILRRPHALLLQREHAVGHHPGRAVHRHDLYGKRHHRPHTHRQGDRQGQRGGHQPAGHQGRA